MKNPPIPFENVKGYDDLVDFLRNWRSFHDPQVYDFGGIVHLLKACLDNLREFAVEGELEDLTNYFDADQKQFLQRLAEIVLLPEEGDF